MSVSSCCRARAQSSRGEIERSRLDLILEQVTSEIYGPIKGPVAVQCVHAPLSFVL